MTTKDLSDKEIDIYNTARSLNGTMDEKAKILRDSGIFDKYKQLHDQYLFLVNTSADQSERLEALKRTIFLNWYHIIEPSCFTGIGELNGDTIHKSYLVLNDYLKSKTADDELKWMLSFYAFNDWAILVHCKDDMPELIEFVTHVDSKHNHVPDKNMLVGIMIDRGQMGEYFKS